MVRSRFTEDVYLSQIQDYSILVGTRINHFVRSRPGITIDGEYQVLDFRNTIAVVRQRIVQRPEGVNVHTRYLLNEHVSIGRNRQLGIHCQRIVDADASLSPHDELTVKSRGGRGSLAVMSDVRTNDEMEGNFLNHLGGNEVVVNNGQVRIRSDHENEEKPSDTIGSCIPSCGHASTSPPPSQGTNFTPRFPLGVNHLHPCSSETR